jgi:hypothetical protein
LAAGWSMEGVPRQATVAPAAFYGTDTLLTLRDTCLSRVCRISNLCNQDAICNGMWYKVGGKGCSDWDCSVSTTEPRHKYDELIGRFIVFRMRTEQHEDMRAYDMMPQYA